MRRQGVSRLRYWLCITIPENWQIVKEKLVWGVEERYQMTMRRLVEDDFLIFYTTNPQKAIAGIYTVASGWYQDNIPIGWVKRVKRKPVPTTFPFRIKIVPHIVPPQPVPVDEELFERLMFVTDKSPRGRVVFFYPSMVLIPHEDFKTIVSWLENRIGQRLAT
jgi:predicted RNA-binding protein